jgi:alginate O-acetyltransferase complex protein AlgI
MGLNSFPFIVFFLPLVTALYRGLAGGGRFRWAKACLLAASLFFYARSGMRHVPYLLASVVFNYAVAHAIAAAQGPGRRRWLAAGIGANLAFLCSFKYFNFFLGALGGSHLSLPSLGFPLGVSFLTIQQIMYLVDCYEEMGKPNTLLDHAVFTTFFAYVTAGPISRARDIVPQLNSKQPRAAAADIARGITLFAAGLFKKVVFADAFAAVADAGFGAPASLTMIESWTCAFAFTLQIYFDFSGYSDMAMAAALFLGIRIPKNFDNPLRSLSIREFWQRWHISLSNFITTYLYTPIVKSFGRVTISSSMLATLLAMLIAGLWHGPAWTFVIFGAMHGAALAVNQYWKKKKWTMANPLGWALTMGWVTLAFVFFRSSNLFIALQVLKALSGFNGIHGFGTLAVGVTHARVTELGIPWLAGFLLAFAGPVSNDIADAFRPSAALACAVVFMLLTAALFMNSNTMTEFVYVAF